MMHVLSRDKYEDIVAQEELRSEGSIKCPACRGNGMVTHACTVCTSCEHTHDAQCGLCAGYGVVTREEFLTLYIQNKLQLVTEEDYVDKLFSDVEAYSIYTNTPLPLCLATCGFDICYVEMTASIKINNTTFTREIGKSHGSKNKLSGPEQENNTILNCCDGVASVGSNRCDSVKSPNT